MVTPTTAANEGIPSNLPIMRLKKHLTMNSPGGDQITEIQYHDLADNRLCG